MLATVKHLAVPCTGFGASSRPLGTETLRVVGLLLAAFLASTALVHLVGSGHAAAAPAYLPLGGSLVLAVLWLRVLHAAARLVGQRRTLERSRR